MHSPLFFGGTIIIADSPIKYLANGSHDSQNIQA
jgi:hypothetical protein